MGQVLSSGKTQKAPSGANITPHIGPVLRLLLHINLRPSLPHLPLIMHPCPLLLLPPIPRRRRSNLTDTPLHTVSHALPKIPQLPLGLGALTARVLLLARAPQPLVARQIAQALLRRADGLVPGAVGALRVVRRCRACVRVCGYGAQFGGCVAGFVLGVCFGLGCFAGGLVVIR